MSEVKHPTQPLVVTGDGVVRFKANAIVRYLLDWATGKGVGMNELAVIPFSNEDRVQFAQLIGYSVSGFGDLSYAPADVVEQADADTAAVIAKAKGGA